MDDTAPRILLVEDDENDVLFLERAFDKVRVPRPFQVLGDGPHVIEYLSGIAPYDDRAQYPVPSHLIIDLKIARPRGLDVLEWLRSDARYALLRVVVLTSSGDLGDRSRAHALGVDAYFVKPSRHADLVEIVRQIAALWGLSVSPAVGGHAISPRPHTSPESDRSARSLTDLDRAKTAFLANVSHEFLTPLTLLLAPLEDTLQKEPGELAPDDRARIETAHRNALRLLKLTNTVLDFIRMEAGRIEASYEAADLARLTSDLAGTFRSAVERAGLRLRVDCPPLPEPVFVDHEMWEKIVFNLLSNALKFTFEGEIEVALKSRGERAELSVRDTGTGIPETELPRLFERFHRVRGSHARTVEGSGLGLALVQEFARLHGATTRVESELGHGTSFTIAIPFGRAHLPTEQIKIRRGSAGTSVAASFLGEAVPWLPDGPATAMSRSDPEPARRRGAGAHPRGR